MALPVGMICRAWITVNGERIYAVDHGKRAFCFFPSGDKSSSENKKVRKIKKTTPTKS